MKNSEMEQYLNNTDDIHALIRIFPPEIAGVLDAYGNLEKLIEVIMDVGRPPAARYTNGDRLLREQEVTYEEIDAVVAKVGDFDLDNRAGMERTLHRISAIRNRRGRVIGLTCRVGRAVFGTLDIIADYINSGKSLLIGTILGLLMFSRLRNRNAEETAEEETAEEVKKSVPEEEEEEIIESTHYRYH